MPTYLVQFDGLVVDQPDSLFLRREITALAVHAPTPDGARDHAIRVTRGAASVVAVYLLEEAPPELVAEALATPTLPSGEIGD